MNTKRKETIMKILIVITLTGMASIIILWPCSEYIWPNQPEEIVLDKMMFFWCLSYFIPGGIFIFLFPIWGLKQRQKPPHKISLEINDFETMKSFVSKALFENQFNIIERGFTHNKDEFIFFLKDDGINVECFLLTNSQFYNDEHTEIITQKANKIYTEKFKDAFSKRAFSGYILVCVKKVDNQFYKFISTINESTPRERFYFCGYTFGGKILYLPQYKDSFASKELKKMQTFLETIFSNG